jgi:hypothetical protein
MRTDLQPFCSNGADERAYLRAPWKDGADVVASNGHIMIVIPGAAEDMDAETPPNMAGAAARFDGYPRSGVITPMSSITLPPAERCQVCGGAGESSLKVAIGNAFFQRRYLALLAALPACSIETCGELGLAKFTFDGGYGFLMPVRA